LGYTLILEEPSLTLLPPALTWLLPFKLGHTLGHLWVHVQNYLNTLFTLHTIYLVITNIWLEIIYNIYIINTYSLSIWVITQPEMGLFENSVPKIRVDHCVLIEIVLNWRYTPFTDPHIPHIISRLASYVPQKSSDFVG
jgi:hypothetical protein